MDTQSLNRAGITCPKCLKKFDSAQALRMHHVRMHTRAGRRGAKLGGLAAQAALRTKYSSLAGTSVYERAKARYAAKGLNAHGQPYKRPPFEPLVYPPPARQEEKEPVKQGVALNYCPNCGTCLKKLATQMEQAE